MASQINYATLNENYPVAGQDNDSQGFRDNFAITKVALSVAKTEITDLQNRAVVTSENELPAENDLGNSSITNGIMNFIRYQVNIGVAVSVNTDVNVQTGFLHQYVLGADVVLRFINWPVENEYYLINLQLKSDELADRTVDFLTENSGSMVYETSTPSRPITLPLSGNTKIIEVYTYDHGVHVYARYLGEYPKV